MPEISRFYGIVIKMYYNDHQPPHFHAEYSGEKMIVEIRTLAVISGRLPPRAMGLLMEWAAQHRPELEQDWEQARGSQPLARIAPLP
jgi:hypothetical protein